LLKIIKKDLSLMKFSEIKNYLEYHLKKINFFLINFKYNKNGIIIFLINIPKKIAIFIIKVYQKTISPIMVCKKAFPFAVVDIHLHVQIWFGSYRKILSYKGIKTNWRLLRCNPLAKVAISHLK
jgi:hypothetical protein